MKKLMPVALFVSGLIFLVNCLPPEAGIKITGPGNTPVAFSGYYESEVMQRQDVDGVTAASYKVKVNTKSDHIRAGFAKTDPTDSTSELTVKLYYRGVHGNITVTEPGDSAIIDYKIK
ncbi:hypothetical protein JXM67_02185 [candidate division WOR-3 bacterium]|nr:hypothetical protein [candidate division WOR-3 bacterium]